MTDLILFQKSFADVPLRDNGVDTQSFLEASDGLVMMFGTFVLPFSCFESCNCSMGVRATWIPLRMYEYHRSKELERGRRLSWRGENISCYGSVLCLVNYWFCLYVLSKDLLGSGVFGFVQSDIRSNIAVRLYFPTVAGCNLYTSPHCGCLGRSCQIRLTSHSSAMCHIGSFSWIWKQGIS
jgi:hypothetical protein